MAIDTGIFELSGKVGDLIFTQGKKRTYVSKKSGKPHQLSENSKKSANDLAEASMHSKIVRAAFASLVEIYKDSSVHYRLNKCFLAALKPIPKEELGEKKVKNGEVSVLRGFRFNQAVLLESILYKFPSVTIHSSGLLKLELSVETNENITKVLKNADRVVLQIGIFSHNLDNGNYQYIKLKDLVKPQLKSAKASVQLNLAGEILLLVVMGVHYQQNGERLYKKAINAAEITHVFRLSDGETVDFVKEMEEPTVKSFQNEGLDWDEEG
ncbi:MAG: hypothetical protein H7202_00650 [Pedobacter sp.]|nr:hypothetical protein [Pedobacter sp.]